jgi:hypothetical protein
LCIIIALVSDTLIQLKFSVQMTLALEPPFLLFHMELLAQQADTCLEQLLYVVELVLSTQVAQKRILLSTVRETQNVSSQLVEVNGVLDQK